MYVFAGLFYIEIKYLLGLIGNFFEPKNMNTTFWIIRIVVNIFEREKERREGIYQLMLNQNLDYNLEREKNPKHFLKSVRVFTTRNIFKTLNKLLSIQIIN